LNELVQLRKTEEEQYGKILTLLDQRSQFSLPDEDSGRLNEVKDHLNRAWDVADHVFGAVEKEDRTFWKEVARNSIQYFEPFIRQQREFNSLVVHLLNDFTESVQLSLAHVRDFQNALILYFQRIVPMVDTKFREMIGIEDKNILVNLGKFQEHLYKFQTQIHEAAKAHADLLFQELDKKMETLQLDSSEQESSIQAAETSLRSLHHLANSLSAAAREGPDRDGGTRPEAVEEAQYFHFEEKFRGSREEIREKFRSYLKYFQNAPKGPVLDLGCGRGEFLELLQEISVPGVGVDSNQDMVRLCRELGLQVHASDLFTYLSSVPENSLGGIFCSQVIEHLPANLLLKLLQMAYSRLQPEAPMLLETVNIGSAFGFLQIYTKDLTHRTPIHPETLKFLVNACGFRKPELLFSSPVPNVARLKLFEDAQDEMKQIFNQNMSKLNDFLYGPQEYAVVAYK
jgi:SAM-dependent methyltransferase